MQCSSEGYSLAQRSAA